MYWPINADDKEQKAMITTSVLRSAYINLPTFSGWPYVNVRGLIQAHLDTQGSIRPDDEITAVLDTLVAMGAIEQEGEMCSRDGEFDDWPAEKVEGTGGVTCPCCTHHFVPESDTPEYLPVEGIYQRVVDAINALPEGSYFFSDVCARLKSAMPDERPTSRKNAVLGVYKVKKYTAQINANMAIGDDGKPHKTWGPK